MPNLGDYIGHLVSEMTIARMRADFEVARIAEVYAGHPLLKHMPVPRFRLPTVKIDVPVLVQDMDEVKDEQEVYKKPSNKKLHRLLDNRLNKENIGITPEQRDELKLSIEESAKKLWQSPSKPVQRSAIAKVIQRDVGQKLQQMREEEIKNNTEEEARVWRFENGLYRDVQLLMIEQMNKPPRLRVLVGSQELRSLGADQTLTHLQLSISEEAYEWTIVDENGESQQRFVME